MKPNYLTQLERSKRVLTPQRQEILVGCILGDVVVTKVKRGINPLIKFEQSLVHQKYLEHLYSLFNPYCASGPKIETRGPNKITGNVYSSIYFITRSLPCFRELFELFYPDGQKIVPLNIGALLTALSLAYWISDDGSFDQRDHCVDLHTEGFTLADVNLLIKTLNDKWDLKCTINKSGKGHKIRIPRKSLPILKDLLKDIMPPMMMHKIGL